jgi:hypothetical protein
MADNALALEPIPWKRTEDGSIPIDELIIGYHSSSRGSCVDPLTRRLAWTREVHDRKSRIFFFF